MGRAAGGDNDGGGGGGGDRQVEAWSIPCRFLDGSCDSRDRLYALKIDAAGAGSKGEGMGTMAAKRRYCWEIIGATSTQ